MIGASYGIGAATATALLEAGARVALSARSEEKLRAVAGESGAKAIIEPLDFTQGAQVSAAWKRIRGALLIWDFEYRLRGYRPDVQRTIHGSSHLRFDAEGRVTYHRDYWDAAEELYAKLPVIGALMRWLRRRLG